MAWSLWRRQDKLCTSGFVDDVTFAYNGPYGADDVTPLAYLMYIIREITGYYDPGRLPLAVSPHTDLCCLVPISTFCCTVRSHFTNVADRQTLCL